MYNKFKIVQAVRSIEEYKNFGVIIDNGGRRETLADPNPPFRLFVVLNALNSSTHAVHHSTSMPSATGSHKTENRYLSKASRELLVAELKKIMEEQLTPDQWAKIARNPHSRGIGVLVQKAQVEASKKLMESLNGAVNIYGSYCNGAIRDIIKWTVSVEIDIL